MNKSVFKLCFTGMATLVLTLSAMTSRADDIDMLLEQSGISKQVAEFPALVKSGFMQGIQQGAPVPGEVAVAMANSLDESIKPSMILDDIHSSIEAQLSEDDIDSLLSWYESDTGKAITAAEVAASTPEAAEAIMANGKQLLADTDRVQIAQELDQLLGATDLAMDIQEHSSSAVYSALMAAVQPDQAPDLDGFKAQMSAVEPQMRADIQQLIAAQFVYTYRDIDDSTMAEYVDYLKQPATQRFNKATMAGLNSSFEKATNDWASKLADIIKSAAEEQGAQGQ